MHCNLPPLENFLYCPSTDLLIIMFIKSMCPSIWESTIQAGPREHLLLKFWTRSGVTFIDVSNYNALVQPNPWLIGFHSRLQFILTLFYVEFSKPHRPKKKKINLKIKDCIALKSMNWSFWFGSAKSRSVLRNKTTWYWPGIEGDT